MVDLARWMVLVARGQKEEQTGGELHFHVSSRACRQCRHDHDSLEASFFGGQVQGGIAPEIGFG